MCPKKGFDLDCTEQEAIFDKSLYILLLINVNIYVLYTFENIKKFQKLEQNKRPKKSFKKLYDKDKTSNSFHAETKMSITFFTFSCVDYHLK